MSFEKRNAGGGPKLYSIHVLPQGKAFAGDIEWGKAPYRITFSPSGASITGGKLVLAGSVKIKTPGGATKTIDKIEATLLGTQGSTAPAPPVPQNLSESLKPSDAASDSALPVTDATGDLSSVGVMYLRLSEVKAAGVPFDLSDAQLNARLYPTSELERDLTWLYSALILNALGASPNEQLSSAYINEINRVLK